MKWYENWFDSKYYPMLYRHRNDKEASFFIEKIVEKIDLKKESKILDLACGRGRHALFLSKKGYDVLGVDLSENSIEDAKKLSASNLRFEVGDMRESLNGKPFDAVFNLFTSFGYFDDVSDNLRVLKSIETMLNKNGYFVIDFMNTHKIIQNLVSKEQQNIDGVVFDIERSHRDGIIQKTIEIDDKGEKSCYKERVQSLGLNDFQTLIQQTNLQIQHIYGGYDLSPYDAENSNRLILVGRKK